MINPNHYQATLNIQNSPAIKKAVSFS